MWFHPPDKKFSMFDNALSFHSERRNFRVKSPGKRSTPGIQDVLLLSNKLLLLADSNNKSVKLYTEQVRMSDTIILSRASQCVSLCFGTVCLK